MQEYVFTLLNQDEATEVIVDAIQERFAETVFLSDDEKLLSSIKRLVSDHAGSDDYVIVLFVGSEYLELVQGWAGKNINLLKLIILAVTMNPSAIADYSNLFEIIYTDSDPVKMKFIISKIETEIRNRKILLKLKSEASEFYDIGRSLSEEKDTLILFEKIINTSIRLTSSDAGTLYLVVDEREKSWSYIENGVAAGKLLKFVIAKNLSIDVKLQESVSPILNTSIFGHSAITGKPLRIEDVYSPVPGVDYKHDRSFDLTTGYRTKSMLCIPMKDHNDNVMGVIQLINKKQDRNLPLHFPDPGSGNKIIPYDYADELLMNALAGQAAVALENNLLYREMAKLLSNYKQQNERLKFLSLKVLKAHEEERKRIAREIHDGPAQLSSSLAMKLEICRKLYSMGKLEEFNDELAKLGDGLRSTAGEIRTIIYGLKPASLDSGLIAALRGYIHLFEEHTGIEVKYIVRGSDEKLEYYLTSTLYRIVQEALSNVHKHANASRATVRLTISDELLKLNVNDNGQGFDVRSEYNKKKTLEGGFGLEGIRERVEIVNGAIKITSRLQRGTQIAVSVPLV